MSVQYNGTTEFSTLTNVDKLCGAGQWTTTFNVYLNALPAAASNGFIISKTNSGAAPFLYEISVLDTGALRIFFDNAGTFGTATSTTTLSISTAYHVAMVFNGSGTTDATRWQMYINGTAESLTFGGAASVANISSATGIVCYVGTRTGTNFLNGFVEEIRMWERPFSPQDVANDRINIIPAYLEDMRVWCPFDSKDDTLSYAPYEATVTHSTASGNGVSISTQTVGTKSYSTRRDRNRHRRLNTTQKRVLQYNLAHEMLR